MTTILKWTSIILTTIGTIYCLNLVWQPNVYASIGAGLILLIIILPLTIFLLNAFGRRLTNVSMTSKVQTVLTIIIFLIASLTIFYLLDLVFIKKDVWRWQSFPDLSGHRTGQQVLDKRIGYTGLIILLCAWLTTFLNLRQTNQKIILATTSFIFHITFWTIIYFTCNVTPTFSPDAGG
mgnify:FL=1|jgi:hypothetical protein